MPAMIFLLADLTQNVPTGPLYAAIGATTGAVCFLFKLLFESLNNRAAEKDAHIKTLLDQSANERREAREDRQTFLSLLGTERDKDRELRHAQAQHQGATAARLELLAHEVADLAARLPLPAVAAPAAA